MFFYSVVSNCINASPEAVHCSIHSVIDVRKAVAACIEVMNMTKFDSFTF